MSAATPTPRLRTGTVCLGRSAILLAAGPFLFGVWLWLASALTDDSLGGLTYLFAAWICGVALAGAGTAWAGLAVAPTAPRVALALTAAGFVVAALLAGSFVVSALAS